MNTTTSSNTLVIFGALVGLAFILVGAVIALVYADGSSSAIVLPILLANIGPLIVMIMSLARSVENGTKSDVVSNQVSQIPESLASIIHRHDGGAPPTAVVVNVPPAELPKGDTPSGTS